MTPPLPATADTATPPTPPEVAAPAPALPSAEITAPSLPAPVVAAPPAILPKPKTRPAARKAVVDNGAAMLAAKPLAPAPTGQPATNYVGTYVTGANGVREFRPGP
jgi:hypothetical protein